VIFKIQGSIWPGVLPFCLFNAFVTIVIYILRERDVIDLHFDGGKGMEYLSVLVSFFVVSSIGTTYNRLWEARAHVGKALLSASLLADRAAIYSANSRSEKAQRWRNALQHRLSQLVDYSMHVIQNERGALINIMATSSEKEATGDDTSDALLEKHGLRRTFIANHMGLLEKKESHGEKLASFVDVIIQTNAQYLEHPLVIQETMDLLSKSSAFLDAFHALIKFSTTPVPFVTVQMGRTITFAWILFLPFVLISDPKTNLLEATTMVFLITFGFAGLTLAEVEMHDPLGHDANDIETDRYTKVRGGYIIYKLDNWREL
jgi:predicted membrane chloride channel (bestrophin family)